MHRLLGLKGARLGSNKLMAGPNAGSKDLCCRNSTVAPRCDQNRNGVIIFLISTLISAPQAFPDHLSDVSVKDLFVHPQCKNVSAFKKGRIGTIPMGPFVESPGLWSHYPHYPLLAGIFMAALILCNPGSHEYYPDRFIILSRPVRSGHQSLCRCSASIQGRA
jgi:hypothetical protein